LYYKFCIETEKQFENPAFQISMRLALPLALLFEQDDPVDFFGAFQISSHREINGGTDVRTKVALDYLSEPIVKTAIWGQLLAVRAKCSPPAQARHWLLGLVKQCWEHTALPH